MRIPPHGVVGHEPQRAKESSSVSRPVTARASAATRAPTVLASVMRPVSIDASPEARLLGNFRYRRGFPTPCGAVGGDMGVVR